MCWIGHMEAAFIMVIMAHSVSEYLWSGEFHGLAMGCKESDTTE